MLNTAVSACTVPGPFAASTFARQSNSRMPYGLPVADHCVSAVLHANGLFPLSAASLAELDRVAHPTSFPEGAVLFVEGQIPRGVYVLCQGRMKLTTSNREGKTLIMKIVQPGEILGIQSVVTGEPYELTVETLQPSQLAFISRADFLRFIKEHADACLHVAQQLSNECQAAYGVIRSIGLSHSVSEKLARLVLQWSDDARVTDGVIRIKVSLTHEEMAQLISTSRETVTRILGELKKRRILELKGSTLTIHNRAALEEMVDA
jgi:CRP/FNR family transcriptional regulator, cyclic AMP receptor protein